MTARTRPGAVPFTNDDIRAVAAEQGVCVRPVLRRVHDRQTGEIHKLVIPYGSTREYLCPPCAKKAQRLRMQQCEAGWHLEEDPLPPEPDPDGDDQDLDEDEDQDSDSDDGAGSSRRVRSTRRRSGMADLPKVPAEHRTIGKTFTTPDGKTYRPSMFVTLTLPGYGKVVMPRKGRTILGAGTPVDPGSYDYRRAALDALHFPRLFDRWIQNLRRCAGFRVQYFAAIEEQRRLAPHAHVAMRGAIPRGSFVRSPRPPTTPCGGRRTTGRSTCTGYRYGTPTGSATATPTPASRCRRGRRRSPSSTTRTRPQRT